MPDLHDIVNPILRVQWYGYGLTAAETLGLPTTSWRPQTPENVLIDWNARMLELLSVMLIESIRGVYLTYAAGDWLSLRTSESYETERITATFASCQVVLTGSGGTPYTIAAGDRFTVRKSGTDITYAVPGPLTIPGSGSTAAVTATCDFAGSQGSAAVGEIDTLVDGLNSVTVTNTTTAVGIDLERDDALRERARLATGPTSPGGAAAAYRYVATSTKLPDGTNVDVTKVLLDEDETTRKVTAYYASASGPTAHLAEVNAAILNEVVPNGVPYEGFSATAVPCDIEYTVRVLAAENIAEQVIKDAIEQALIDFFSDPLTPIRGFPYVPDVPGEGEITTNKIVPVIGGIKIGTRYPVNYAAATINGNPSQGFVGGETPTLGTITPNVVFT